MTTPAQTDRLRKSDPAVEKTRAITGLIAVIAADVAIALAAILGIVYASRGTAETGQIAAILSSGFTALGTTTTAYFGIKSMSNTAKSLAGPPTGTVTAAGAPSGSPTPTPVPPPVPVPGPLG